MKNIFKIALLFLTISLVSCDKEYEANLQGEWHLISKPTENVDYVWYFNYGKVYIMATDANENEAPTGDLDTCTVGNYVLKNAVITIAAKEAPCRGTIFVGDWDIEKLDKNYLTIRNETANGTVWYEFIKK